MSPTWESPDARRARHADVAASAVAAGSVAVALALGGGVRGIGLLAGTVFGGGVSMAVLSARRAGWDWGVAWRILAVYGLAVALLWGVGRALGYQ